MGGYLPHQLNDGNRFLLGVGLLFILFLLESWAFDLKVIFTPCLFIGYVLGWICAKG